MLSFTAGIGNLFPRLGKIGLIVKQTRSYQASQKTNLTDTTNGLVAQYNTESDLQAQIGSAYISLLNSAGSSVGSLAGNLAQATLNRMVFEDSPGPNQTLSQVNLTYSLSILISQMKTAGASVLAMMINTTTTQFVSLLTNIGNGIVVASTKRPLDGLVLENSFAENLIATCVGDSYSGGSIAGNEPFRISGTGTAGPFDFNWPLGSGALTSLSAINGNANNSSGNLLTNSGFETWSANIPGNFTIETGASTIFKEASITYDGIAALRLLGDGSTLSILSQTFGSSSGTFGTLQPQTQYSVNLWARRDGTAAGAGQLTVELTDSSGVVIKDANNANNSFTIGLTALTTVYTSFSATFRTPVLLPTSPKIRLRLSTALTSGRSVYFDKLSLGAMTQAYTSGPFIAIHAGSIPFAKNDLASVAVTNSRGAAGTLSTFQTLVSQLFPQMLANEYLLPSSSSPTISDSVLIA